MRESRTAACDVAGAGNGLTVRLVRHCFSPFPMGVIGRAYGAPRQPSTLLGLVAAADKSLCVSQKSTLPGWVDDFKKSGKRLLLKFTKEHFVNFITGGRGLHTTQSTRHGFTTSYSIITMPLTSAIQPKGLTK